VFRGSGFHLRITPSSSFSNDRPGHGAPRLESGGALIVIDAKDEVPSMEAELMETMRRRRSSRLLVIDRKDRVLLFKFVFHHGPLAGRDYWAPP